MTLDKVIKEQLYFEDEYTSKAYLDVRESLFKAMEKLDSKILRLGDSPTKKDLTVLYSNLYKLIDSAYGEFPEKLSKENIKIAQQVMLNMSGQVYTLDAVSRIVTKTPDVLGYDFNTLFKSKTHADKLKIEIASGVAANHSLDAIVRSVNSKNKYLTDYQLKTAVNTTITQVRSDIQYQTYKDLEGDDTFYQSIATLDSRTSEICRSLDGRKYYNMSIDDVPDKPPRHFSCRSKILLRVKGYGIPSRASAYGSVDGSITYNEWAKANPSDIVFSPYKVNGWRTANTLAITDLALAPFVDDGIKIGTPVIKETPDGLSMRSGKGAFDYQMNIDDNNLTLNMIQIPEAFRNKEIGLRALEGLVAIKNTYKLNNVLINTNSSKSFENSVYLWLASGRAIPKEKASFNKYILDNLKVNEYEKIEVQGLLQSGKYSVLFKDPKYKKDITRILEGSDDLLVLSL